MVLDVRHAPLDGRSFGSTVCSFDGDNDDLLWLRSTLLLPTPNMDQHIFTFTLYTVYVCALGLRNNNY